jgi:hypothetical protein
MEDRERDKFYSPPEPTPDDEEYELEPLDPSIVSAEERHAKQVGELVRTSIDIDEVYSDAERNRGTEIVENWARNFRYRFHIKHLLFATAAVAIGVAAATLDYLVPMVAILVLGSIAGLYFYLNWQDRQQQAEAYAKRQELYAKRREQMKSLGKSPAGEESQQSSELVSPAIDNAPNKVADTLEAAPAPESIRIHFSLRSLIVAMTLAAISFGIIRILGGPGPTATILGFIAVAGLLVHAIGLAPPQPVILGWWFILVLYVILSIVEAMWVGSV